jgi:predicted phage tail protein
MTAENLLASIIFSSIGLGAWIYGKKTGNWKPMVIGVVLMVYPYFIAETWQMVLIGAVLTAALFVFRD